MQPAVIQWKTQMNATVVICMWSDVREEDNHISDSDSHNWQWGVVLFFFSFHATCLVDMRSAWHWNYHNYRLVTTRASHAEHSQYVLAVRAGTLAKLNFVLLTLWKKKPHTPIFRNSHIFTSVQESYIISSPKQLFLMKSEVWHCCLYSSGKSNTDCIILPISWREFIRWHWYQRRYFWFVDYLPISLWILDHDWASRAVVIVCHHLKWIKFGYICTAFVLILERNLQSQPVWR